MDIHHVFHGHSSFTRWDFDRDEFGDESPEIDIDVMTTKPLLMDGVYHSRAICSVAPIASSVRFIMWSYEVNRGGFITAILNMLELDLLEQYSGSENERSVAKEILTREPMVELSVVANASKDSFIGGRAVIRNDR